MTKSDIINKEIKLIASNKKAYHDYFLSDLLEAGIVLEGSEVKSLRQNGMSLNESFVYFKGNEIFLKNAYIKSYEKSSSFKPDERKDRKLLLHKVEIGKLKKKTQEKGFSIIPTKIYFSKGKVKVEIALAKGKHLFDKREALKEKVVKREIDRAVKFRGR